MSCMGVCAGWAGRGRECVVGMREGAGVCYCVQKYLCHVLDFQGVRA